jgi:hypothetical protein
MRNQWMCEPDEPDPDVVRHAPTATPPCALYLTADSKLSRAQVEVVVVHEPLGIGLVVQRGSQVVVSSVEPASMAAVQRVGVGSVLHAVNGHAVGNMAENAAVEMIQASERPWRLLLRISPPPTRQNTASASLELALSQPTLGSHERQEVTLAQLPGTAIELGSSRRDQRRRSSALIECRVFGSAPLPSSGRRHGDGARWAVRS